VGVVAPTGGGSGVRIEVDPDVLIRSGQKMSSLGSQLVSLSDALGAALSSGIASGMDPAGANFGIKYGHQAQQFADTLAMAATAYNNVGYMLQATGFNYKNADAVSTIGGSGPAGGVGEAPGKTVAGHASVGPNSIIVTPPALWYLVEPFIGIAMEWPSGHPALMRVTAAQWKNIGHGLSVFNDELAALKTAVSVQHIPEAGKIGDALTELGSKVSDMSDAASQIAQSVEDFANGVQRTQDAIRRLLGRLSPEGLFDTVKGFLTGDGEKILRELGHDIGELLHNFQQQIKGIVGLLGELTSLIGDAADAFEKWIRPILVAQFGADVGGALADGVTFYTDFEVGLVNGVIGTVSGLVSLADADTWKGIADLAASVAEDPTTLPGVLENMGKQFVAWDQWTGDHPGRAAGEAAFNIGSLFVPGGPLTKTGSIAKGFKFTKGLIEDGKLGQLGKLSGLAGDTKKLEELGDLGGAGSKLPDVPEFKPAPGVPDSIVNPKAPDPIDVPSNPHSLDGPAGPPDPPSSTGTPGGDHHGAGGGDRPPPDPPGRSTGPADTGPAAHSPQPSPVDSQHGSAAPTDAPSSNGETPPATQHAPESSSPASPHETAPSPAEPGPVAEHGSSATEPGTSPADRGPGAPAATGDGQAAGSPGGGDHGANHPGGDAAPGEHRPGSPEYGTPSDDRAHAPADQQPAHTAAGDPPGQHHNPASDGQQREHADAQGSAEERREPAAANQPAMVGGGMPMTPHVGGGGHGPSEGRGPGGRSPDIPARDAEGKAPQERSPEKGPRAQEPGTAGPGSENPRRAPVDSAAKPPSEGGFGRAPHSPLAPSAHGPSADRTSETRPPEPKHPSSGSDHHPKADDHPGPDDHAVHDATADHHPGSQWDGPAGQHAADLLPSDDSGYRVRPRDCEFLGISPEQVEHWANREAPLGMTPTEFKEFSGSLFEALERDGLSAKDLDLRLQGSSARFFSGEHKSLPLESEVHDNPAAQARMTSWLGDDADRPLRRPFDSMHRLGLEDEPSDYDLQLSSDKMAEACRSRWEADGSEGDLVHRKYGFINKKIFEKTFPGLFDWAEEWTERTGRPVVPALFSGSGPPDTSAAGVSSHFRESDWRIHPEGSDG
jgi:hypothetical protein